MSLWFMVPITNYCSNGVNLNHRSITAGPHIVISNNLSIRLGCGSQAIAPEKAWCWMVRSWISMPWPYMAFRSCQGYPNGTKKIDAMDNPLLRDEFDLLDPFGSFSTLVKPVFKKGHIFGGSSVNLRFLGSLH